MKGLFVNQVKNQCSIYESGVMVYNALATSFHKIDYLEVSTGQMNSYDYSGYDFYIFNWHHNTLPISSSVINKIKGLRIGVLLEVGQVELRPFMPEDMFDAYIVLDPTKSKTGARKSKSGFCCLRRFNTATYSKKRSLTSCIP